MTDMWKAAAAPLALLIALAAAPPAAATPPDRPIDAEPLDIKQFQSLRADGGVFRVPLSLKINSARRDVVVTTLILSTDPLRPAEIGRSQERSSAENGQARLVASVPVMREPGVYKIEIAAGDLTGAVYDRVILFQEVTSDGAATLYSQEEWRDVRKSRRSEDFRKQQSVGALGGPTRAVTAQDLRGLKVAPANDKALLVRPEEGSSASEGFVRDVSKDAWRARDPVTYRGRFVYTDFEGTVRPLVNAGVYLYDDDTFGDDFLGSVATDGNGAFSFSVNNDDGFLQNGRDLYVMLKLRNSRWQVRDGGDYEWKAPQFDDVNEGSVLDIGTHAPGDDMEAAQVFAFMDRAWQHITFTGGRDPGSVEIDYPSTGDFFDDGGPTIHLSAATNRAPDIALHEYGHHLMQQAYPGGDPSPAGAHNFVESLQDARLSWSEGFASGFMLSSCNDGQYNWDEGTTENAGEWPACTTQNDLGGQAIEAYCGANREGERQEARVAGALLDLMDFANDGNGGNEDCGRNGLDDSNAANRAPLSTIYNTVMWGSGHQNMLEFWNSLAGEITGQTWTDANEILRYNWMSIAAPIDLSCVASKVAAAELGNYATAVNDLRAFRDTGLKPFVEGREMMRLYYRHSPELAELLIKNPEARKHGAAVVSHFAKLGAAAKNRKGLEAMFAADGPVVPKDVDASVRTLMKLVADRGSPELRKDTGLAQKQYERVHALTFSQAMKLAEGSKRADDAAEMSPVRQQDLAPASRKADWKLIRSALPPEAGTPLPPVEGEKPPLSLDRLPERIPERRLDPNRIKKPAEEN